MKMQTPSATATPLPPNYGKPWVPPTTEEWAQAIQAREEEEDKATMLARSEHKIREIFKTAREQGLTQPAREA
jgi:hypothetical protein